MKKTVYSTIVLGLTLLCFGVNVAGAYTVDDHTLSTGRYMKGGLYDSGAGWIDVIGAAANFDVRGINVSRSGTQLNFELYTNMSLNRTLNNYNYYLADLAIGIPGEDFGYGVVLNEALWDTPVASGRTTSTLSAGLYQVNSWFTSRDLYLVSNTGIMTNDLTVYGDLYWGGDYLEPLVAIESGELLQALTVTQTALPDGADALYRYTFSFDRSWLEGIGYEVEIFWGGASCGNDAIVGSAVIPEPGTLTLFGAGLVGLALMRKKTRKH